MLEKTEKEIAIRAELLELTGLDFSVIEFPNKTIWASIRNNEFEKTNNFDRSKLKEYYEKISTAFAPVCKPMKYVERTYENFAPANVKIDNKATEGLYKYKPTVTITFTFEELDVRFEGLLLDTFDSDDLIHNYIELKPKNVNKMGKTVYYLGGFKSVKTPNYDFETFAQNEGDTEIFMETIFGES